jgi:hypothetical protein
VNQARYKAVRISVVLATIVAWFSISNHCALGALIASQTHFAAAPMHCHGSQSAPPKKSGDEDMPCCKVLRATVTANVQTPVTEESGLAAAQSLFISALLSLDDGYVQPLPEEIDTGPPFLSSFAELILQRSLLAHAPPVLA